MNSLSVTAPGKLFISGEYAVLEGAPAVVTSVERRVEASIVKTNIIQSPIVEAVSSTVSKFFLQRNNASIGRLPLIKVVSNGFVIDKQKLGIGSSSAVSAAATGLFFKWQGLSISENKDQILKVALDSHMLAQQGRGSGADVATSVLGGTIIFSKNKPPKNIDLTKLQTVFVWTGNSASTVNLVDKIEKLKKNDKVDYDEIMKDLCSLAFSLSQSYKNCEINEIIYLTHKYALAMTQLGKKANASIVTDEHKKIIDLAKKCKGSAKPSGAGGGDMAIGVFLNSEDSNQFKILCQKHMLQVINIKTHVKGIC